MNVHSLETHLQKQKEKQIYALEADRQEAFSRAAVKILVDLLKNLKCVSAPSDRPPHQV